MQDKLIATYAASGGVGSDWYKHAHDYCQQLSHDFDVPVKRVAGIVSALSPACNWATNKLDALRLLQNYRGIKGPWGQHRFSSYGRNVKKAADILHGKGCFNPVTGPKTYHFFNNLLDPSHPDYVTIDRHMVEFMTGDAYKGLSLKKYEELAQVVKDAACEVGVIPNALQAVVWTAQRHAKKHGDQLTLWR